MSPVKTHTIRPLAERPGYLETVSKWVWEHWHDHSGLSPEETRRRLGDPAANCPPTLVAEEGGAPVGVLGFQRFGVVFQEIGVLAKKFRDDVL